MYRQTMAQGSNPTRCFYMVHELKIFLKSQEKYAYYYSKIKLSEIGSYTNLNKFSIITNIYIQYKNTSIVKAKVIQTIKFFNL